MVANQVSTFRQPAISDHGLVRVDFPAGCFPDSWRRPTFADAVAPTDVLAGAPDGSSGPDITQ